MPTGLARREQRRNGGAVQSARENAALFVWRAIDGRSAFFLGDGGHAPEVALIADLVRSRSTTLGRALFLGPDDEDAALAGGGE